MSSSTWTPAALSSDAHRLSGTCWRFVEAQHLVSTTKLTDTSAEQDLLEAAIERTKPAVPAECRHLNYLLSTPFRYPPRPFGSRFRRPGQIEGVFYGGEATDTAAAEVAFHRLLFFAESPLTPWPANPAEYTAFAARFATKRCIDLTRPPYDGQQDDWRHPTDYAPCQAFADAARAASIEVIRYTSVRDPQHRANVALLTCRAFAQPEIDSRETWRVHVSKAGARVIREFPRYTLAFDQGAFAADPRIAGMDWNRPTRL